MPLTSELVKQLASSLPSALLPYLTSRYAILPFLNPQIADDMWVISSLLSVVAGFVAFGFARQTVTGWAIPVCTFAISIAAVIGMLAIATENLVSLTPASQSFFLRVGFLLSFVTIAFSFGWGMERMLKH